VTSSSIGLYPIVTGIEVGDNLHREIEILQSLESKPTRRWARQACRRHQRDRSRPWRAPNPGEIDEKLNCSGS